ncbi:MAG: RNA polymerase sigma factor [SAR324 cluster bacterium]|nr:RNA polymerase sigma factor [SAR324 cluster bacterium]
MTDSLQSANNYQSPSPEQILIEQILQGNTSLFDQLITQYRNQVYRFILKYMNDPARAEDLAQDTFIAAYEKLNTFEGNAKFSTWLLGIARNKVLNDINRAGKRRSQMVSDDILQEHHSLEKDPLEEMAKKQVFSALKKAIDDLDGDIKDVLILVSLEGLSYDEVSGMLKIPVGTVKSKLFRARTVLKEKMKKQRLS